MKLSDKQYKLFTRVGLVVIVAAALAYDRVPNNLQQEIILMAAVGAVVGFFPLLTSQPFHAQGEREGDKERLSSPIDRFSLDAAAKTPEVGSRESIERRASASPNGDPGRRYLPSSTQLKNSNPKVALGAGIWAGSCDHVAIYELLSKSISRDSLAFLGMDPERERSERMIEMHELINKLRGIPQEFSVELKSNNSIIVRCERPKESVNLLQQASGRIIQQNPRIESTRQETVH